MAHGKYFDTITELPRVLVGVWHARGNQGAVGATGIFADLVLRVGGYATSFGIFGAEKAGAPIMAFNRISSKSIEAYYAPGKFDYVVILDPAIDNDPKQIFGTFLAGTTSETIFIVNTPDDPETTARKLQLGPARIITVDATGIAKKTMPAGFQYPNTAMLGALAHLFPNLTIDLVKTEISAAQNLVEKGEKTVAVNVSAAEMGYAGIREFDGRGMDIPRAKVAPPVLPAWNEYEPAGAIITTANAYEKNTGSWRVDRPVRVDEVNREKIAAGKIKEKCVNCMLCYIFCPDFSILVDDQADPHKIVGIDYDHCKGCGVCKKVCPYNAIAMISETRAKANEQAK